MLPLTRYQVSLRIHVGKSRLVLSASAPPQPDDHVAHDGDGCTDAVVADYNSGLIVLYGHSCSDRIFADGLESPGAVFASE